MVAQLWGVCGVIKNLMLSSTENNMSIIDIAIQIPSDIDFTVIAISLIPYHI